MAIFSKETLALFSKHGVDIRKVPQEALYSGIPIPVGDNVYALMRDGKEIFRGSKKEIENVASHLKTLKEAEVLKYLNELIDLKQIDEAIKKLNIKIIVPKNTLGVLESSQRMKKIYDALKTMKGSNKFNPSKNKLKLKNKKVPLSKNGISADFQTLHICLIQLVVKKIL